MKTNKLQVPLTIKASLSLFVVSVVASKGCSAQRAQATLPRATANDVQLYVPFNGSLDALKPTAGVRAVHFKAPQAAGPDFVEGLEGKGLRVTGENQNQLNLIHGLKQWPAEKGSLVVWFKPAKELKDNSMFWLVQGGWATFDMHVEGGRLMFYCTGSPADFLVADLKEAATNWVDKWHCAVGTWDGEKQALYLDGKLLVEKNGVKPIASSNLPTSLTIGHLPQPGKPPVGYLQGDMDEVALLSASLSAAEIASMVKNGKNGLLNVLGGDILGSLERRAYVRGEKATLKLFPYAKGDTIKVTAIAEESKKILPLATTPARAGDVVIDTSHLRPGRYNLRLELLAAGKEVVSNESLVIGVNSRRVPEFPVGIDSLSLYPDKTLAIMQKWNIGLTSGMFGTDGLFKDLDRLYLYGISTQPNMNIHYHNAMVPFTKDPARYTNNEDGKANERFTTELVQGIAYEDGQQFSWSLGSPFSRVGREAMKARLADFLRATGQHPALHSLSFDDEYDMRVGTDSKTGKRYFGDYGPEAAAYFKEKTGMTNIVLPPKEPEGTVFPDNHPYFTWRDVMGMPGDATTTGLAMNNAEQTALIHKLRPDVLTTSWSGGEYGEVDAVMDYTYPTIWQPNPGYEVGHARLDFMFDRHRARQRVEKLKPVWGLTGWWSNNLQGQPAWNVEDFRLSTAMTLAKGAKLINWFTSFPPSDTPPGQLGAGLLSRDDLAGETERWANWIHRYGGMFSRLESKPSRRVAVLISETNTAGLVHKQGAPIAFDRFYPAMRIAGVPVDLITDEQVLAGKLAQYEALCLFNIRYSSTSLWKKIQEYAGTNGKVVICDEATHPALRPAKAVVLDVNVIRDQTVVAGKTWMETVVATVAANASYTRQKIAPLLRPDELAVSGSNLVAPHWLYGNEGRLLSLVNYNIFGTETVTVSLQKVGGVVYDLTNQKVVVEAAPGQTLAWKAEAIEKAGWKPYLLVPRKIGSVGVSASLVADTFTVATSVRGANATPLKAPVPIQVEFLDPSGKPVPAYETFTALNAASGVAVVKVPRAKLMDGPGVWTVRVTELASGLSSSTRVRA